MKSVKSPLPSLDLNGQRIFLRADLNVPLKEGAILSDTRLKALIPTINLILNKGGKIILATHIGRPLDHETTLSTKTLLPWFAQQGYTVVFENNLQDAYVKSFHDPKTILLLENLRFYPGEKQNDPAFAQSLARLGDVYVNDAFGNLHHNDCSMIEVPRLFTPHRRIIGLLIEKELIAAQHLLNDPTHPVVVIVGGNKINDKIPMLKNLIESIDFLLLCPAIVFAYLKSQGLSTFGSIDSDAQAACEQLAQKANTQILVPLDYMVSSQGFSGPYTIKKASELKRDDFAIAIGPETQKLYVSIIKKSKTSFYNGLMGDLKYPQTLTATKAIFQAMADSQGFSCIGGGDSAGAAQLLGFNTQISSISSGGGALMALLSGQKLPTLELLLNK